MANSGDDGALESFLDDWVTPGARMHTENEFCDNAGGLHRGEGTHRSVFAGMADLLRSPGYGVASRPVADGGTPTVCRASTPSKSARVRDLARAPERRSGDPWRPRRTGTKQIARAPNGPPLSQDLVAQHRRSGGRCGLALDLRRPVHDRLSRWRRAVAVDRARFDGAFARKAAAADETIGGTFTVTYEDLSFATGVGFDDPVSGAARRETLRAVLLHVTSVLDVPGTADLLVRASQTDGRGPLAAAGPYLLPLTGFQGGLVFEHLTTGVDPLENELDGVVTVDFGFRWNTETSGPSPVEYDLYTVLLHEVTHALGFVSIVGPDGASALGNEGELGLFSLFDAFLVRGSTEQPLFLDGGEINASAEDVTSEDVLFAGSRSETAFGSFPPVFAPNPFLEGSSIGHWSFLTGDDAVMLPR